jgi:hypothetical protein
MDLSLMIAVPDDASYSGIKIIASHSCCENIHMRVPYKNYGGVIKLFVPLEGLEEQGVGLEHFEFYVSCMSKLGVDFELATALEWASYSMDSGIYGSLSKNLAWEATYKEYIKALRPVRRSLGISSGRINRNGEFVTDSDTIEEEMQETTTEENRSLHIVGDTPGYIVSYRYQGSAIASEIRNQSNILSTISSLLRFSYFTGGSKCTKGDVFSDWFSLVKDLDHLDGYGKLLMMVVACSEYSFDLANSYIHLFPSSCSSISPIGLYWFYRIGENFGENGNSIPLLYYYGDIYSYDKHFRLNFNSSYFFRAYIENDKKIQKEIVELCKNSEHVNINLYGVRSFIEDHIIK